MKILLQAYIASMQSMASLCADLMPEPSASAEPFERTSLLGPGEFSYGNTVIVYAETVADARYQWHQLSQAKTPCLIWLQGKRSPWAGFPIERLAGA